MLTMIIRWVLFALALMLTAWLVPGISVDNFVSALIVVVVIALINIFIKPLINMITLPINAATLGIFAFVINALLLMLAGYLAPGFGVDGFISALIGSLVLSVLGVVVTYVSKD